MIDAERVGLDQVFAELLTPEIDPAGDLAVYKASVASDLAVTVGQRFVQPAEGPLRVEAVEPIDSWQQLQTLVPTREIDERFAGIRFNPEVVSFISLGRDADGQPKPAVPIVELRKLAAVARTTYSEERVSELIPAVGLRLSGLIGHGNGQRYDKQLAEEYLANTHMIRADKLPQLVPLFEESINRELEEYARKVATDPEQATSQDEKNIALNELLLDVLSMCRDRLFLEAEPETAEEVEEDAPEPQS